MFQLFSGPPDVVDTLPLALRFSLARSLARLVLVLLLLMPGRAAGQDQGRFGGAPWLQGLEQLPEALRQQEAIRLDLAALAAGYGRAIRGVVAQGPRRFSLLMADGRLILYDDGRLKGPQEKLDQPDLEDMLAQPYRPGLVGKPPGPDEDPGRIRVTGFFQAVYGATPTEVQAQLVAVPFLGTTVRFQGNNGAAAALARVGARLSQLLARQPSLCNYLLPVQGTYNYRRIAGTDRLSPHAWGIAIDLHRGTHWRWGQLLAPRELLTLQVAYPQEIVRAFEAEGFIWGGKWYHYDTLHFEYRPELLAKARLAAELAGPAREREPLRERAGR
ncbi:MAG: M15 family metallopeptidase [Desulfobacca sp.]|uniref:M15 family metallopeptidase n=1 Tax=Desulfobacca sp. TaxID=2067990 RepID=UPI0040493931